MNLAKERWNKEICMNFGKLDTKNVKNTIDKMYLMISNFLDQDEMDELRTRMNTLLETWTETHEQNIEEQYRPQHAILDRTALIFQVEREVPWDVMFALSVGPKFIFPTRISSKNCEWFAYELLGTVEQLPVEYQKLVEWKLARSMYKHKERMTNPTLCWLEWIRIRTNDFLNKNIDIIAVKSDKGNHTVIMLKSTYNEYMTKMFDDHIYYKYSLGDPLPGLLIKDLHMRTLLNKSNISLNIRKNIPHDLPIAYGLPKINKNFKLRPIVPTIGSPGYEIGKAIKRILENIFPGKNWNVKNACEAKTQLEDCKINSMDTVVSFDVKSMFTNIPVNKAIEIIMESADKITKKYMIKPELFKEALLFCLEECTYIKCKDTIVKQKMGLPMGGVLSPIISRIVMDDLIQSRIVNMGIKPKLLLIYVDDSIFVLKKTNVFKTFLSINKYDKNITFTLEPEVRGIINFLNVTIINTGSELRTKWYKKEFASNRMINYMSGHGNNIIKNTVMEYINNVLILSHGEFFHENRNKMISILRDNSWPEEEITLIMNNKYTYMRGKDINNTLVSMKNELNLNRVLGIDSKKNFKYISLPHATCISKKIQKDIEMIIPDNHRITHSTKNNKINCIRNCKDNGDRMIKTNRIIYIKCHCKKRTYILVTKNNNTVSKQISEINYLFDNDCKNGHTLSLDNIKTKRISNVERRKRDILELSLYKFRKCLLKKENKQFIHKRWQKALDGY